MGSEEFKQYLYADQYLNELYAMQNLEVRRAYADIFPTRAMVDYSSGRVFVESIKVDDYAIWLVDMKEIQKRQRQYYLQRHKVYQKALKVLTLEELNLLNDYKLGDLQDNQQKIHVVLIKFKAELERLLGTYPSTEVV